MSDAFVQSPRIRARLLPQCRRGPLLIPVPTINRRGFSWPASIYRSVLDQSHRRRCRIPRHHSTATGETQNRQTYLIGEKTRLLTSPSWTTATAPGHSFCLRASPPGWAGAHILRTPESNRLDVPGVHSMTNPSDALSPKWTWHPRPDGHRSLPECRRTSGTHFSRKSTDA